MTAGDPGPSSPAGARDPSYTAYSSVTFGRRVSFLDAIYGFAVTLLIANVDAPAASAWASWQGLLSSGAGSQLLGFALSFTVIAVFWRINVGLVRRLKGLDSVTISINIAVAGLVILIAFTTQGISDPDSVDLAIPAVCYALNIALVALGQTAMFEVARARGLERSPMSPTAHLANLLDSLVTPGVFLISIPVALTAGATAGKLTWAFLFVLGPMSNIVSQRIAARVEHDPGGG